MPSGCLSDAEILVLVLGDPAPTSVAIARHLTQCADCRARVTALREVVFGIEAAATTGPAGIGECLDEIDLAVLVDGGGDAARRTSGIAHLAACGRCREQYASLRRLLADPDVAAQVRQSTGAVQGSPARRRLAAGAWIAAAAAVVLVVVSPQGPWRPVDVHRGPTITASAVPTPMSPVGDVASVSTLQWTLVAGADRYRVTLFDAAGAVLFETQVTDTALALPDSVVIAPGRSYLWMVEARTEWGRWSTSDLIEFRVAVPSPTEPHASPSSNDDPVSRSRALDSLRLRARGLSDSALAVEAQAHPLDVREALSGTLALAVHGAPATRAAELATARRLAAAYASAWHDAYLVREVERFVAWTPKRRAAKVWVDSTRRAGVTAFSGAGVTVAVAIWQRALAGATENDDTAGMAATLGNIGAAFSHNGLTDSATSYLERARRFAVAVGDMRTEANAVSELAGVSEQHNDAAGARQRYAQAIALHERVGDSRGLASDYNNLSGLAQEAGDLPEARRQLEAALAINRRDNHPEYAATNLVNLATLASLTGDFARADAQYREALGTWRVRKQWADVADAMRDLGKLELRRGDYPAARTDLLEALALYDRTGALADGLSVRQELAGTRAAEGDLQGALDDLRQSQRLADSAQVPLGVRAGISLARADLATQLNSRPEAERLYAGAEQLYRRAGDRSGESEAQQGHGALLLDQGNVVLAQELLDAALRTELSTGSLRAASLTRMLLGRLSLQRGDTVAARRHLARASADLERLGDPVAAAAALGEQAALEAASRLPAAAESLFRAGLAKVGERIAPEVTWRLHAGLGGVLHGQGAIDAAGRELRAGIADIERAGRSLALAERRSGFRTDKWDVYVQLALLERTRGRVAAAFDVSERLRAGEMRELLGQGRVAAPPDTASDLAGREQDLRRRIGELTRGLEGSGSGRQLVRGPDVAAAGAVTREALLRAQESYTDLLLEIRERAPRHAALVSPDPSGWRDVAQRLAPDEAFVEYLVSDAASLAFIVTRDTVAAVRLGAGRHDLARLVDFVRGTLQPRGSRRLDSLWQAPLRQLYRDLIAPVEASGLLAGKTRLTLVPHAELHYLPFAALLGGEGAGQFLVERYDISVTPSASVWLALGARRQGHATAGIIAFAPWPEALPASGEEVAAIARFGGATARVVVGADASEATFRREAPSRRVIHLATYGVLNKQNPLFSFVELAPGGSNDGRLEAHEVFGLRLNADLVVLSACQTGLASGSIADVPAGDDWVGLARAFLSAGAGRVMATLWPVQDRASATLMERFYERYRVGTEPAKALAAAQRELLGNAATASPYHWAGFEVVGGR